MGSTERRYDLAGTGSMVIDRICTTPRLLHEDEKVLLQPDSTGGVQRRLVGGVALNHLGWARLFGLSVAIFGKQANDDDGRFLRQGMSDLGITPALDLSGSCSSFSHVYVDPRGGRAIYMARGATAELSGEEIDTRHRGVIEQAARVSTEISQVPLAAVRRVLEIGAEAGAETFLDVDVPVADAVPGLGSHEDLHAALSSARVIKASRSSLEGIVSGRDEAELATALQRKYGTEVVILTLGAGGSAVLVDGTLSAVAPARVDAIDTTGAGDAFLGGVLAGRHHGLGWPAALRLGSACGAACCERLGGFPDEPAACLRRALELHAGLGGAPLAVEKTGAPPSMGADDALDAFLRKAGVEMERCLRHADREAIRRTAELVRGRQARGGRVHVTGVGKGEHVAHYAASLLASTGTPATFLHGTEATHGSVGQVAPDDTVIAVSNSGETRELLETVAAVRGMKASVIAITRDADSTLGREADLVLLARVEDEGGPLGLAPRASVLAEILILAALSVQLQVSGDFDAAEYNRRHPGGSLGELSS